MGIFRRNKTEVMPVFNEIEEKLSIIKNKIKTPDDIRNAKSFTANFSKEMHQHIFELHQFLTTHFYTHSNISRMDKKSQKITEDLF